MNVWNGENEVKDILSARAFNFYEYVIVEIDKVDREIYDWLDENRRRDISVSARLEGGSLGVILVNLRGNFEVEAGGGANLSLHPHQDKSYRRRMNDFVVAVKTQHEVNELIEAFNRTYKWDEVDKEVVKVD